MWKTRIQDFFKNKRRRRERNHPAVRRRIAEHASSRTRSDSEANSTESRPVVIKNVYGLPNFQPERPAGEDDASIEAAKAFLKSQGNLSSALRRDQAKIDIRMEKTYPDRRKEILAGASVSSLKDDYPDLLTEEGVSLALSCLYTVIFLINAPWAEAKFRAIQDILS